MSNLKPCPFCGQPLHEVRRRRNPYARCLTEDCMGRKLPMISLDLPEDIAAWNTRYTPEGWQLVPVEPTKDMRKTFHEAHEKWQEDRCGGVGSPDYEWRQMLKAAPNPGQET